MVAPRLTVGVRLPDSSELSGPVRVTAHLDDPFHGSETQHESLASTEDTVQFTLPSAGIATATAISEAWFGEAVLSLESGASQTLWIDLEPTQHIRGRVIDAYSSAPIEGAEITTAVLARSRVAPVLSKADGTFTLRPWIPGSTTGLSVNKSGYGEESAKLKVEQDGSWEIPARFGQPSASGERDPFIRLELPPEKRIVGRLVGYSTDRLADVRIEARGLHLIMANIVRPDTQTAAVDEDGRFRIEGLRSDITHDVVIRHVDRGAIARTIAALPGEHDLGDIRLPMERRLSGLVMARDLGPIAGARVELDWIAAPGAEIDLDPAEGDNPERDAYGDWLELAEHHAYTDAGGRFEILGLGTGAHKLRVRIMGRTVARRDLDLTSVDRELEPLVLSQDVTRIAFDVASFASDGDVRHVELAELDEGQPLARFRPEADGHFFGSGFKEGREYVARILTSDGESTRQVFELAEGQTRVRLAPTRAR